MDMVKKIALTASVMLFVLAQLFSCYVIFASQREKIDLLVEKEGRMFMECVSRFNKDLNGRQYGEDMQDHVLTYCFRENMPEYSALYKGEDELYNGSPYRFDVGSVDLSEKGYPCFYQMEKINGRHILVFCEEHPMGRYKSRVDYMLFYIVDVTYVYEDSMGLMAWEAVVSVFVSLGMALLLVYLIKKITRPLQAVNEAQRQLIGSMSHEMKTPLTAMKGYSETLLSVNLSKEQEEKALRYINQESGRLSRLSEKMMELTRLYEPECRITLQEVSVEDLFDEVGESVKHRLEEKEIQLVREGQWQGRKIKIDADLMASFLINLINNSVMASEAKSHIYLGMDEHTLWVRDEGCGIPPEEVDKVRKAFYRVDKSRSRKSGNMGLGLALCEQIAAVHQGRMEICSQVGKGTKVVYRFFTSG